MPCVPKPKPGKRCVCAHACSAQVKLPGIEAIMFARKNMLGGIKTRSDTAGEKASELEDVVRDAIQNETSRKRRRIVQSIGSRGTSSSRTGESAEKARGAVCGAVPRSEETAAEEFSEFNEKCELTHPRSRWIPSSRNMKNRTQTTRHVWIQLPKTSDEDETSKGAEEPVTDPGTRTRTTAAVTASIGRAEGGTASAQFGAGGTCVEVCTRRSCSSKTKAK